MFDVTITTISSGCTPIQSFLPEFIKVMRTRIQSYHKWCDTEQSVKELKTTFDGQRVEKISPSSWGCPIFSEEPLADTVTYVQLKLLTSTYDYGGIFFGISKTNTIGYSTFLDSDHTVCLYNDATSLGARSVDVLSDCSAKKDDVIGLVADKAKDEIRFYRNGMLIARGKKKPSEMEPMYLCMWLYYDIAQVELCNDYLYSSLRQPDVITPPLI
jgi:hypothetical protein